MVARRAFDARAVGVVRILRHHAAYGGLRQAVLRIVLACVIGTTDLWLNSEPENAGEYGEGYDCEVYNCYQHCHPPIPSQGQYH